MWHLIIRKSYVDIEESFFDWLKENCVRMLVCQHSPDDEDTLEHCHVMIVEFTKSQQALDKQRKVHGLQGAASRLLKVRVKTREAYNEAKLGQYCIKGKVDQVKMVSGYDQERIETWAELWTPPSSHNVLASGSDTEKGQTHWQIIEEFWKELEQMNIWEEVLGFNDAGLTRVMRKECYPRVMDMLQIRLNERKVRTSRNELERFFVTLMRHDASARRDISDSILRSVFR